VNQEKFGRRVSGKKGQSSAREFGTRPKLQRPWKRSRGLAADGSSRIAQRVFPAVRGMRL